MIMGRAVIAAFIALFAAVVIPVTAFATFSDDGPAIVRSASSVIGYVYDVTSATNAYASKDTSSQVKLSLKKGDTVFVIGSDGDWYQIFYRGEKLYVKKSAISEESVKAAETKAAEQEQAINEELEQQTKELDKGTVKVLEKAIEENEEIIEGLTEEQVQELKDEFVEKYGEEVDAVDEAEAAVEAEIQERQQEVQNNALIWKIVIGVLVVAIIAVSIFIALKNRKNSEE